MTREVVIVLGKTGMGKSVMTRKLLQPIRRIFAFDPYRDMPGQYINSDILLELYDSGKLHSNNNFFYITDNSDDVELFGSIAYLSGHCALAIEEMGFLFNSHDAIPGWMREMVFGGRHRFVSLYVVAQRAVSIPIDLRSQATRLISFAQHEGADVNWLKNYFGTRVEEIPHLNVLECLDSYRNTIAKYKVTP